MNKIKQPKPCKNILITEYFNHYDTLRSKITPDSPIDSKFNSRNSFKTSRNYSENKHFKDSINTNESPQNLRNIIPRLETRSFFENNQEPPKILQNPKKSIFLTKNHSFSPRSRENTNVFTTKAFKMKRKFDEKTENFLDYLNLIHSEQKMHLIQNNRNKSLHLELNSRKTKHSTNNEYNIFYDNHRESTIKGLNTRLYYGKKSSKQLAPVNSPLIKRPTIRPPTILIQKSRNSLKLDSENENQRNFILSASNFKENRLLLEDMIKAIKSLKKQKNEHVSVKIVKQILGNSKKLLDSLIDPTTQLYYDPLSPRSFFLRLTDANKSLMKIGSFKSFRSFNTISQLSETDVVLPLSPLPLVPRLELDFIRLLMDFKVRLQEASISIMNERYTLIKESIIEVYEKIVEKELKFLQKQKIDGNKKKYEKIKKELKSRFSMTGLESGSILGIRLKQCEDNCGELVQVDRIEKVALDNLENAIFSIRCKQADIYEAIQ